MKLYSKVIMFLALVLAFSGIHVSFAASTFPDVPEDNVNNKAVEYLKQKGIISGYPDGTFKPDKSINRAEALKIALNAAASLETQEMESASIAFPDVKEKDWFYTFVSKAFALKIAAGYPDGKFKPANNINVAESLKIIENSLKGSVSQEVAENPFPDVDKGTWYAPYALYAKNKQIVWVLDDGKVHAERDITRGEFAQIIYRLVYIKENKVDTFPLSTDWPQYRHPAERYTVKYPFSWEKIEAGTQLILWKRDKPNNQVSFARVFPNGATLVLAVDKNPEQLSLDDYIKRVQYEPSGELTRLVLNKYPFASISLADQGIIDFYIELPDKSILIGYSQIGSGLAKSQLSEEMRYIVGSIRYDESPRVKNAPVNEDEAFLSAARQSVMTKDQGKKTISLFSDAIIIETDSIGIGTGPVDYYYSTRYDVTLKYERSSDVILSIEKGKKTSF